MEARRVRRRTSTSSALSPSAAAEPGPKSFEELFNFMPSQISTLTFPELARLLGRLHCGVDLRSYYSGMDCPGQGLHAIVQYLVHAPLPHGLALSAQDQEHWLQRPPIRHLHACDLDPACRRLLCDWECEASRPAHVFGDICVRAGLVLDEARLALDHARAQHKRLREELQEVSALPEEYARLAAERRAQIESQIATLSDETVKEITDMLRRPEVFPPSARDYCYLHGQQCLLDDLCETDRESKRIVGLVAGTPCTDHSARGSRSHFLGETFLPFAVFVMERRSRREAFMILECTPLFDPSIYVTLLGDLYLVWSFIWSPHLQGFPVRRPRRFSLLLRKDLYTADVDFNRGPERFKRTLELDGDIFASAPESFLQAEWDALTRAAGLPMSHRQDPLLLLSPGARTRLEAYVKEAKAKGLGDNDGEAVLVDVSQNVEFGTIGPLIPSLTKTTTLVSPRKQRPLIP